MSTAGSQSRASAPAVRPDDRGMEVESLHQINKILDAGLDKQTIQVLLELLECGVHPEALADVVLEIKQRASKK